MWEGDVNFVGTKRAVVLWKPRDRVTPRLLHRTWIYNRKAKYVRWVPDKYIPSSFSTRISLAVHRPPTKRYFSGTLSLSLSRYSLRRSVALRRA